MPKVIKYQRRSSDGLMDAIHGMSYMINEIWLPDHKVLANIVGSYGDTRETDSYVANAFFADAPILDTAWVFDGTPDTGKVKTIEIEISQDLYDTIVHMAETEKTLKSLRESAGPKIVESLKSANCFDPLERCEDCHALPKSHKAECSFCLCGRKKEGPHEKWCYHSDEYAAKEDLNPKYHKVHTKKYIP